MVLVLKGADPFVLRGRVRQSRGNRSLTPDALSSSLQEMEMIGAEGVEVLASAMAKGVTQNLAELNLVSLRG